MPSCGGGKLVISARGPGGGYRLARSGTDIFVAQIIDAVDEAVTLPIVRVKATVTMERPV